MPIRYIGSKARIAPSIMELVGTPDGGRFVDGFCGTGVVAKAAAAAGWPVLANDYLQSAAIITRSALTSLDEISMLGLSGYESALLKLNQLPGKMGFIAREYSPSSIQGDKERKYFMRENASRIDAIRCQICRWLCSGLIGPLESDVLVSDLIHAANRVANTAGTYGHFLRTWSSNALKELELTPTASTASFKAPRCVTSLEIRDVVVSIDDTLYLDPPYTKRQYAAYYHIQETIAHGDEPTISGKSGLRPWRHLASDFCYKRKAVRAFESVLTRLPAKRVLISYSGEAHVSQDELEALLCSFGSVTVHDMGHIGRYRPNAPARRSHTHVQELLFELNR